MIRCRRADQQRLYTIKRGIYLRESGEYVGPFGSLEDAEAFLALIGVCGVNCNGIEIVIEDLDQARKLDGVTAPEKRLLQTRDGETDESVSQPELPRGPEGDGSESGTKKEDRNVEPDEEGR